MSLINGRIFIKESPVQETSTYCREIQVVLTRHGRKVDEKLPRLLVSCIPILSPTEELQMITHLRM